MDTHGIYALDHCLIENRVIFGRNRILFGRKKINIKRIKEHMKQFTANLKSVVLFSGVKYPMYILSEQSTVRITCNCIDIYFIAFTFTIRQNNLVWYLLRNKLKFNEVLRSETTMNCPKCIKKLLFSPLGKYDDGLPLFGM